MCTTGKGYLRQPIEDKGIIFGTSIELYETGSQVSDTEPLVLWFKALSDRRDGITRCHMMRLTEKLGPYKFQLFVHTARANGLSMFRLIMIPLKLGIVKQARIRK